MQCGAVRGLVVLHNHVAFGGKNTLALGSCFW